MQYTKIYNFMGNLMRTLVDNTKSDFYVRYDGITWEKQNSLKQKIKHDLPELFINKSDFITSLLKDVLIEKLETTFSKYKKEKNYDMILTLLEKLDILLGEEIKSFAMLSANRRLEQNSTKEKTFCLNDNIAECNLQILPKCTCNWSHNKREKTASKSINVYLKNCYYILQNHLGEYNVNHLFLTNEFERANNAHILKVGLTPVCNTAKLDISFYEENETDYFKINAIENEKLIEECILSQLELAKENDIDIMLFPEMLGSQKIINDIKKKLQEFNEDEKEYPSITICPTSWSDNKNVCIVLDKYGEYLMGQEKQHPFSYIKEGKKYIEGIFSDNTIHLIHCEGIGRIAILICKDALQRDYLHLILEELKATLIIVPSFSTGSYDFVEILQMCRAYDCCTLWINTCSVQMLDTINLKSLEAKGYLLRTGKATNEMKNESIEFEKCPKSEGFDCKDCIYIGELLF